MTNYLKPASAKPIFYGSSACTLRTEDTLHVAEGTIRTTKRRSEPQPQPGSQRRCSLSVMAGSIRNTRWCVSTLPAREAYSRCVQLKALRGRRVPIMCTYACGVLPLLMMTLTAGRGACRAEALAFVGSPLTIAPRDQHRSVVFGGRSRFQVQSIAGGTVSTCVQ